MTQRQYRRLLMALGQVAYAHHVEGPTERVLSAFDRVSQAYAEHLNSRQTVGGYFCPLLANETLVAGAIATADRLCGNKV